MPVTDGFLEFVVDQLANCGEITVRRMFGAAGLYAGDVFFAIASGDVLYLKVDDSNRGDFEAAGTGPFTYRQRGEVLTMGYYQVPLAVLEDADELERWARKAIRVAVTKRPAPRRRAPTAVRRRARRTR